MLAFDFTVLADVNASLNGLALILIIAGLVAIKQGKEAAHKTLMLAATGVSALFLASYLIYHFNAEAVKFTGEGTVRSIYFFILISHIVLAVVQVPLILITIHSGLKDNRPRHLRFAKITAPIWLYVSFTGVIVYLMLYVLYPQ